MKTKFIWAIVVVLAASLSVLAMAGAVKTTGAAAAGYVSASTAQKKRQYPISGEINRSFQLSPNAQIDVVSIEGAVKVETSDSNRAELHYVRHALTQADFDCESIVVEDGPSRLSIEHRTNRSCHIIQAYEELTLIVPQSANLTLRGIEGDFIVSRTDGFLHLNGIEGSVQVGGVQAAEIRGVEGNITLTVARLDSQGITVRGIEGNVELRVADNLNANLRVRGADRVDVDLPNVPNKRTATNSFQSEDENRSRRGTELQLGAGGPEILISGIEGRVRVRGL
jgi:hypothetical protein